MFVIVVGRACREWSVERRVEDGIRLWCGVIR